MTFTIIILTRTDIYPGIPLFFFGCVIISLIPIGNHLIYYIKLATIFINLIVAQIVTIFLSPDWNT